MKVAEHRVNINGHLLHRLTMSPDEGVPIRMGALFYHGQGDYADRYPEVLAPFTERGVACVITDFPGHGHSPGRRGHGGDEALLNAVIRSSLALFDGMPYAVMGHSMGGLLAARHLVLAGQGQFRSPSMAWINAPLIQPTCGRPRSLVNAVQWLASWFPKITISTGVTSSMCRQKDEQGCVEQAGSMSRAGDVERSDRPLWHSRISLGWAKVLLDASDLLQSSCEDAPEDVRLLLTQGGDDPVCPASLSHAFFQRYPSRDESYKHYVTFDGGLHELFSDENREALTTELERWLDRVLAEIL
ncbi:alpha/beta fold hydrolase [Verrucomicrobiaceae bacterium N1E253]|uniref:Alpha/beta fold hydrolase n=1 Tax=Oceaniferula marina TaxID=2748318 RepID=A0A851GAF7_9BACT|nr:alpha/beta fold hydrolase [Oceaniferula marina]NWK54603.1 alpha/beta fold hydrolase [Oceaniferula marina]